MKRGIVTIERGAIGADGLGLVAHVDEDVRMIERRRSPHAHELLGTDFDDRNARVVVEVRNSTLGHGRPALLHRC